MSLRSPDALVKSDGVPRERRRLPVFEKPDVDRAVGMVKQVELDVAALYAELSAEIEGEVRFDRGSVGLYATDSSNFRQIPLGVVVPRTLDDVVRAHRVCSRHGAPIVNRGGGTSLSGETVNMAVVIDQSKYLNGIGEPDTLHRRITVEAGAINEKVNEHAGRFGLVFGPDPSSHAYCTIGGNVGNNSCGVHSVQSQLYGPGPRTSDNVHEMEIVTYDGARFRVGVNEEAELPRIIAEGGRKGEIYAALRDLRDRYADAIRRGYKDVAELPRRVSGYNLDELLPERGFNVARALVGTENTCATALEITLLLTPGMLQRCMVVVAYQDACAAADHVPELMRFGPIGLEAIDQLLYEYEINKHMHEETLRKLPSGHGHAYLFVEFGAEQAGQAREQAERMIRWLEESGYSRDRVRLFDESHEPHVAKELWQVREAALAATTYGPHGDDRWPGWEDSAVPPARLGEYLRDLRKLYEKYKLQGSMYGHFGQGCVHSRISFDLRSAEGIRQYRAFLDEASDLVVRYGGSLSGEHGDGQQRAEFLHKQYGEELVNAMREFKRIWDPDWRMNPGKVIDPYRVDQWLKLGTSYNPARPETKFAYPEDHGDFAHATLRCVGVGKCRKPDGVDVMCPSYIVTREEKHCTRGRARLLFEMLEGEVIRDGFESREVFEALDLCLACKGCTNDCPVNVDMPTYKAEFLYHHYKSPKRFRKRSMYAFGFIDQIARVSNLVPDLANFFTQAPGLSEAAKLLGGMDRARNVPKFAPMSLQTWFRRRGGSRNLSGPKVILWPDTFNNYFHTQVGVACVEALEAAGHCVEMPRGHVCCGRPLYDFGFLDVAKRYLTRTLASLRDDIRAGVPVVGMEPSCVAVFRDELTNMLPHDDDAQRLSRQTYHFAEFFDAQGLQVPAMTRKALVWGHCHHKATGGMQPELRVLGERMGMDVSLSKGGCCGLAGSWGFEAGRHEISMECGEIGFLPSVREAERDTLIVADGFSCKTQLAQSGVGRTAMHTAEVMAMAREHGASGVRGPLPERGLKPPPAPPLSERVLRSAAGVAVGASVVGGAVWALKRLFAPPRAPKLSETRRRAR